ncbi:uncharacterized protein SOCE26_013450 [Sorangium cellulosum]|uniref:Uncharacterized protein n=1 Tax=Sorangium cellulosum TaxID=56 RepID=A0A2L0EKX7_SORCE|nr:hypothetical protein [Sorangium cellulosum]AUX39950.1 uncharacterized protein SOCE26_013450 [Sorangium cellulosum]
MTAETKPVKCWHVKRTGVNNDHIWVIDDGGPSYLIKGNWARMPINREEKRSNPRDDFATYFGKNKTLIEPCSLGIGQYHPRIYRPHTSPRVEDAYRREHASSLQAARNLLIRMKDVFRFIEPVSQNCGTYGHELRQLLILACTEVESSCKAVLKANGYSAKPESKWNTADYVKLLIPLRLSEWEVALRYHPDFPSFKPFDKWDTSQPTQSLDWYNAYNAVKHDRESAFTKATLYNMISAMGGAFVLVHAQFGQFGYQSMQVTETDEFYVKSLPSWSPSEYYAPPQLLGEETWRPVNYSF